MLKSSRGAFIGLTPFFNEEPFLYVFLAHPKKHTPLHRIAYVTYVVYEIRKKLVPIAKFDTYVMHQGRKNA